MDFISDLLMPGNMSIASTLVLYSFVIAAGIYIGKLRIFGVSLGVTFVLLSESRWDTSDTSLITTC